MNKKLSLNKRLDIGAIIISILISEGIGIVAGCLTMDANMTYASLKKPIFSPPGIVFAIVWPILFLLMAVASYRVWSKHVTDKRVKGALITYGIQLILNFLWSMIFFRFNLIAIAFLELIVLLIFIIITAYKFYRIDRIAGYLMIPYILWVIFAGVLNYSLWILNCSV